jgi:glycosyltransferase involved in cell wall biosynthesis
MFDTQVLLVVCSNRGPMPEVLGDTGLYFDHENPADIAQAIRKLILSPELRSEKAKASFELSQQYSWGRCADQTFSFLVAVAHGQKN